MIDYRKQIIDTLIPYFQRDERYILLLGDMGFGAVDKLIDIFPQRVVNFGIMEQGAAGIAAGMSLAGLIPIYYTMVNFIAFRAIEQIRNDVLLQKLNVKFIGTGANNYFSKLGPSHTCGDHDRRILELIGMEVFDPYEGKQNFVTLVDTWINSRQAGYIRV